MPRAEGYFKEKDFIKQNYVNMSDEDMYYTLQKQGSKLPTIKALKMLRVRMGLKKDTEVSKKIRWDK